MTAKYKIDRSPSSPEYVRYWDAVIGPQYDPEHAVQAFDLVPGDLRGFEEWVGEAQVDACRQGFDPTGFYDVGACARWTAQDLKDAADELAKVGGAL